MKKIIICITAVVAAAALFAACENPDSYIDNQDMNEFGSDIPDADDGEQLPHEDDEERPPRPVYYRKPLSITRVTLSNVSLIADEDAILASVNQWAIAIQKDHNVVISFAIAYENSGYLSDPRTEMPVIDFSDNVSVIDTEIDDSGINVYYSVLVKMSQLGVGGWIECSTSEYSFRSNIIAVDEMIKDGNWLGAGRLTHFETPAYPVNSSGTAYKTHIIYLYGGQSMTNHDLSFINAYVNDEEEPVDSFWFRATSSWGSYSLITPHEFEFASDFAPATLSFKGHAGDHTAFLGYVFAWYE